MNNVELKKKGTVLSRRNTEDELKLLWRKIIEVKETILF